MLVVAFPDLQPSQEPQCRSAVSLCQKYRVYEQVNFRWPHQRISSFPWASASDPDSPASIHNITFSEIIEGYPKSIKA